MALALAMSAIGAVGTVVVSSGAAQAAPCGYYVKGERGYIHNCDSYGQWGKAIFFSGQKKCMWLNPGKEADFGYDRNIESGGLAGQGTC
ncbi:hypothetical protein [Micromonospora sp. NPDC023888]|uniref:hypothetical protein n=1 Tax=Micromonospora sp. NPDC023888 TaxID=3155607 RepID=UPI0033E69012